MKYRWIMAFLCVAATYPGAMTAEAAPKTVSKNVAKALSQKQKELLHNAFGAIWIDSDLDDADIEFEVRAALNAGITPNARDEYGDTLLLQAVENGRVSVVRMLLRRGANSNLKSLQWKDTPLRRAMNNFSLHDEANMLAIFRMLLQRGANVNERDENGLSSLMLAASSGHDKIVEMLLMAGADYRLRAKNGETALKIAMMPVDEGDIQLSGMPYFRGEKSPEEMRRIMNEHQKQMEKLSREEENRIRKGRTRIIKLLRRAGAKE